MSLKVMAVCRTLQIHPCAKAVLMALANTADDNGYCYPSIATISTDTCFADRSIKRAIQLLETIKCLAVNRNNGRKSTYQLNIENIRYQSHVGTGAIVAPVPLCHTTGAKSAQNQCQGGLLTVIEQSMNGKEHILPSTAKSTPQKKRKAKPEPTNPEAFNKFWEAYPRKEAKPRAIAAFNDLNPDEQLLETIIGAIEKAKSSDKWKANGGQYIFAPVNYLRDEHWNDVIEIEAKPDKFGWDAKLGRHTRPTL